MWQIIFYNKIFFDTSGSVRRHRNKLFRICSEGTWCISTGGTEEATAETHRWSRAEKTPGSSSPPVAAAGRSSSWWWSSSGEQLCRPPAVKRERRRSGTWRNVGRKRFKVLQPATRGMSEVWGDLKSSEEPECSHSQRWWWRGNNSITARRK